MKRVNFLSKTSSQSYGHSMMTSGMTVGSPSLHRRYWMLRLMSVLALIFTFGCGQMWGATGTLVSTLNGITSGDTYYIAALNSSMYYTVPNTTISGQTFTCTEGSLSGSTLTPASGAGEFVFTAVSGVSNAYYIYNTNLQKYLVATAPQTFGYVLSSSPDYGYWTFTTVSSGGFSGVFSVTHSDKTHYMRAYSNSVRCYNGASNNGVYLFKKAADSKVSTPTFSVAAGTYNESKSVTLSCATAGATIRYTTNGSNPTSTSTAYSSAITVDATKTIKAKAFKNGLTDSDVASATYTIKCATPTFNVNAGTYTESKSVTLSTTYGTKIYYTTNGSDPTTSSTEYTGAITVSQTTTIKAIAWKSGCSNSEIASRTYTIKCATPTFSVDQGTYTTNQSVELSTTYGDKFYYTTNGNTPTTSSSEYTGAIAVSATTTIKAIAWKEGCSNSDIGSRTYTIKCATPTFSVANGAHHGAQSVELSCVTEGATIYYTIGSSTPSNPTSSSTPYTGAITVDASKKIKAIAIKSGLSNSDIANADYTIQYQITWNDNGGHIGDAVWVNSGSTNYTCPTDPSTEARGNCGDRFMGWTNNSEYESNSAPSVLFTNSSGSKPAINSNMDFYAVFADYVEK